MVENSSHSSALRIIDASFNRAMEGLRVAEEYARMHLDDAHLSKLVKQLRHDLASKIGDVFGSGLLSHRDILNDVGTTNQTSSEYERTDMLQIFRANIARTLQSLRSMEEYSKLTRPAVGESLEKIRYGVYAIEKAVANTAHSKNALADAQLYVLTSACENLDELAALTRQLVAAKVDLIQLRDKNLDDGQLVAAGKLLTQLTQGSDTRWIMNDRADLAVISGAHGVHVGQTDLTLAQARRIVGGDKLIGLSTHNFEQANQAVMAGANYIGMGPAFASQTKSFDKFAEQQFIADVAQKIALPAFAIGGINDQNLSQLFDLGVKRIALSNSIVAATDPQTAASHFKNRLQTEASLA